MEQQNRDNSTSVKTWLTECFEPSVESTSWKKKFILKYPCLLTSHSRELMEMYNEIIVVFMSANIASILQPIDQEVILTFNSCHLKLTFHRAKTGTDSNSSDESGQSQLENFIILDTKKSICNSWEEAKNINITGVCKNLIPALMDDLKDSRFQEETTGGNDKATVHRVAGSQTQLSD